MKAKKPEEKRVIGWREYVSIPEWGIRNIRAKIDTGARTSSLHVEDVKLLNNERISFHIISGTRTRPKKVKVTTKRLKKGHVRSSTGNRTHRWYVKAGIELGGYHRDIVINITRREGMNFRMLLGRTAIDETFLVDADRSFLLGGKTRRQKK